MFASPGLFFALASFRTRLPRHCPLHSMIHSFHMDPTRGCVCDMECISAYDVFCLWFLESFCYHTHARPLGHGIRDVFNSFFTHCRGSDPTDAVQTDAIQDADLPCLAHWVNVCFLAPSSSFVILLCTACYMGVIIQKKGHREGDVVILTAQASGWLQETAYHNKQTAERNEALIILFSILSLSFFTYAC